jgi:hypothetical protein
MPYEDVVERLSEQRPQLREALRLVNSCSNTDQDARLVALMLVLQELYNVKAELETVKSEVSRIQSDVDRIERRIA